MKKLMIAAAIVCAAVMAQANSIKWGSGGVATWTDGDEAFDLADNFAIYLFDGAAYNSATIVGEIKEGNFDSLAYAMDHDVVRSGEFSPDTLASEIGKGSPVNYFALLFDNADATKAGYVFATQTYTENMPDTGTLFCEWDGDQNIFAFDYRTKENWTQVAPEPTSGLLLLIGMAGLALRRRRA